MPYTVLHGILYFNWMLFSKRTLTALFCTELRITSAMNWNCKTYFFFQHECMFSTF